MIAVPLKWKCRYKERNRETHYRRRRSSKHSSSLFIIVKTENYADLAALGHDCYKYAMVVKLLITHKNEQESFYAH